MFRKGNLDSMELIDKIVIVHANGILYKGKLLQMDDENIHLITGTGYIAIPTNRVTNITESQD